MPSKLFLLLPLVASLQVAAQGPALQRCPQIAEPAARLACYDAVQPPVGAVPSDKPLAMQAAPAAAGPPSALAAPDRSARFGLSAKASDAELASIESTVASDFYGWGPNERITLQNGQVWMVVDGSSGSLRKSAAQVTVRRGALGSFFMDFEGLTKAPRVRRVQ